jgi:hypothetical protein
MLAYYRDWWHDTSPSAIPAGWAALPSILSITTPDFVQAKVRNSQSLASMTINPALEPSSLFVSLATKTPS